MNTADGICGAGGHHLATVEDVQYKIVEKMQTELEHFQNVFFKLHAFHFPKTFYLNNCNHKGFFLLQNCLKGLYNLTTCYNVTTYVRKLSIVHESLQVHHRILNSVQFLSRPQSHLFSCESFKL